MGGFGLTFNWIPDPSIMATGLESFGNKIRSFREPLTRSIREVVAPSMRENFDTAGRGTWEPLMPSTQAQKGGGSILVETGLLSRVAGQLNIWSIDRESATLGSLPRAGYGTYHQYGTVNMVARPWAVIWPDDADAVERIFEEWIEERLGTIPG